MRLNKILTKDFLTERLLKQRQKVMKLAIELNCSKQSILDYCKIHDINLRQRPSLLIKDLTDKKFGKLKVIALAEPYHGKARWLCKCECGKTKLIAGASLIRGLSKSCGYCSRNNFTGYKDISGVFFKKTRKGAEARGLEFKITIQDIWNQYENQNKKCWLSGLEVYFYKNQDKGILQTASIDRIDSSKGYVIGNIQIIHKRLNLLKNKANNEEFLTWSKLIYKYNKDLCDNLNLDVNSKNWEDR